MLRSGLAQFPTNTRQANENMRPSAFLALLATGARAHVSLVPAGGHLANNRSALVVRIPHGVDGLTSSRFQINVPAGVRSVAPEDLRGWSSEIRMRALPLEEQYSSHGQPVTTGPETIIYTADTPDDTLPNPNLLDITISIYLGCVYNDPNVHTIWKGQHTLWWGVEVGHSLPNTIAVSQNTSWTGCGRTGNELWDPPTGKACPCAPPRLRTGNPPATLRQRARRRGRAAVARAARPSRELA